MAKKNQKNSKPIRTIGKTKMTPKEMSEKRVAQMGDAMETMINHEAIVMDEKGFGRITTNEINHILLSMAFNYNSQGLKNQQEMKTPKTPGS